MSFRMLELQSRKQVAINPNLVRRVEFYHEDWSDVVFDSGDVVRVAGSVLQVSEILWPG